MERRIIKNATAFLIGMSFIVGVARAEAQSAYSAQVNHRPTAQERSVQRDVQAAIDQWIEELAANDLQAVSRPMSDGFTIRLLDGTTLNRAQAIEGMRRDLEGILKIDSDRTYTRIECLTLSGREATLYTRQQYVRTMPDRTDDSPHEVITGVRHVETCVYTKEGWIARQITEIEQGPTFLDGDPYDPR